MSNRAHFLIAIGLMLDEHEEQTGLGRRGCVADALVHYWCCRQREEAAMLIGYFA